MDDTALLEAVRKADPATNERIAHALDADPAIVKARLKDLKGAERVTHEAGEWRLARDPRLDSSVDRMTDRLGRERR